MASKRQAIPTGLKIVYTLWVVAWVSVYWASYGAANFLWFCNIANLLVLAGLWADSRLLLSSQAVGGLFIQIYWAIDFFGRLLSGVHPLGGTEYMFDAGQPLWVRSFSLFHLFIPILVLSSIWRLGYDRRGWKLQTALAWIVLPLSMLPDPERNLNWVWELFGMPQTWVHPAVYLVFCMLAYPLLLYLPAHLLLQTWMRRSGRLVVG